MSGSRSGDVSPVEDADFVRPFVITGGRAEPLQADLRPTTDVEVADRVGVPRGAAKVLISDLVVAGQLAWRHPAELPLPMLERIRDHVRAL